MKTHLFIIIALFFAFGCTIPQGGEDVEQSVDPELASDAWLRVNLECFESLESTIKEEAVHLVQLVSDTAGDNGSPVIWREKEADNQLEAVFGLDNATELREFDSEGGRPFYIFVIERIGNEQRRVDTGEVLVRLNGKETVNQEVSIDCC